MKKSREDMKKEILGLIRFNRERIPADVLQRAELLATEQLKQQQKNDQISNTVSDAIPYDKQAAQEVIAKFLSTFDKDGSFIKKLKQTIQS